MIRTMYHTQEHRVEVLASPCICVRDDAWLGIGYYFWYYKEDADSWGTLSKRNTGAYEIYETTIDCENVLDTVFDEKAYKWWIKQIEKTAMKIIKATGKKPTLKELNDFFRDKGIWQSIEGIMFQDLANKYDHLMVKPIEYSKRTQPFAYKKRIQLAVYQLDIVRTFELNCIENC